MNSSRTLQITAAVATLAFVSYVLAVHVFNWKMSTETVATSSPSTSEQDTQRDILSYVPADTIYFFGGLEPAPLQNMLDVFAPEWGVMQQADFQQELTKNKDMPPAGKMLAGLFVEYLNALKDPKAAPAKLGIGKELDSVFYSVGVTPVMRIKLDNADAFNAFINNAEISAMVTPTKDSHGALNLKTYSFNNPGDSYDESSDIKLAISVNDGYALITLLTPLETPETREVILGTKKPVNPLTQTTVLQDLKSKYAFHPAYLGYINHEEIITGLTAPDDNEFGRMLGALIKTINQHKAQTQAPTPPGTAPGVEPTSTPQTEKPAIAQSEAADENPLAAIQTAACRSEFSAISKMWPRTIFGYTEISLDKKPRKMAGRMLVENTDAAFMQQLQKLRGFIPAHLRTVESKPVFGMGFGFNIDEFTPVISQIYTEITQKDYQCQALAEMKQKLLASNPVLALGMMTGMAAGVQGISASILNIDGDMNFTEQETPPDFRSIDAMLTISAKDPQQLLLMAANFQQGMPPIQLPADGTPVDLPIPLPIPPELGSIKLALKGNHIVAYIGPKAEQLAQSMTNDPLAATGIFAFNMDFGKYMEFISEAALTADMTAGKIPEQNKAMLKEMTKMDMQIVETFDIAPQGIAFDATMTIQ